MKVSLYNNLLPFAQSGFLLSVGTPTPKQLSSPVSFTLVTSVNNHSSRKVHFSRAKHGKPCAIGFLLDLIGGKRGGEVV